jgi:membrane dipeptidase
MKLLSMLLIPAALFVGFQSTVDYRKLHADAIVVDTHNDVVQRILAGEDISRATSHGHSDLPRFLKGGLDVQVFSIWVPPEDTLRPYFDQADTQIDSIESFVRRNPSIVGFARSAADIERLVGEGKFVAMLGVEGGHVIEDDTAKLSHFYARGVRYMTLTWNNSTSWATSAKDETDTSRVLPHKGLTEFGRRIVADMNAMGMIVDVSHVGEQTFWDVMAATTRPVIASHSSVWNLSRNRRNLKDSQLQAIKKNGGVVFINFAPWFIDSTFGPRESAMEKANARKIDSISAAIPEKGFVNEQYTAEALHDEYAPFRPTLATLMKHFDYVAKLIGVDHVGIGSDFDGIGVTPSGMDDVSYLPAITDELLKMGYSADDVRKILGGNFLRVLKDVERR